MGKRSVDQVSAPESVTNGLASEPKVKKSKSERTKSNSAKAEHSEDKVQAVTSEERPETKEERKERRRLKKAAKAAKASTITSPSVRDDATAAASEGNNPSLVTSSGQYKEHRELSALPQSDVEAYLSSNFISIIDPRSEHNKLRPLLKFSFLPFLQESKKNPFREFKSPTPIQAAAWPFLLDGRDVIGVAETGSGKTMAFAVPCVRFISSLPKKTKAVKAVVVSPTRELAMQSYEQITKLADAVGLKVVCVYGGVSKYEQRESLKSADIVVATPGRLNDLIQEGSADITKASYVVLDEADRMLDKGFEDDIRKIIDTTLPLGQRQTLMFTATWPESVRALAATFMVDPIKIAIGNNPTGDLRANTRIVQKVEVMDGYGKEPRLHQLLKQYQSGAAKDDRIIVFCLYKKETTRVENFIRQKGFKVAGIHGDLTQEQRTRSLEAFKAGTTSILVATDVAARGLDIPAVKLVINYTFPLDVEGYVHRIGRTGRAGKEGLAITFFTVQDKALSGA